MLVLFMVYFVGFLSIFLSLLRVFLALLRFIRVRRKEVDLVSLYLNTRVYLNLGPFFSVPLGIKVGGVILGGPVNCDYKVIGVKALVILGQSIDTRIHLLLPVIYQGLNLLLCIALAVEPILKEALHLEVGVGAGTGIACVSIIGLAVWCAYAILVRRRQGYLGQGELGKGVRGGCSLLSLEKLYFLF